MRTAIRAVLAAVLAWCVGAAAAATLGLVGVSLIGATLADRAAPSPSPTAEQSAQPDRRADDAISSPTARASPSSPVSAASSTPTSNNPSTRASDQKELISSPGGTVLAQCSAADASLVSVNPAPGYRVTRIDNGPAPEATVTFQSAQGQVEVVVRCSSGMPQATIHRATMNDDVGDD